MSEADFDRVLGLYCGQKTELFLSGSAAIGIAPPSCQGLLQSCSYSIFCFGTDVSIFRSAAVISGMTLLSRITGLIRDILIARVFGVSGDTDAYYVAFRLPNLLRRLFAEGAFQQAFVPMLADVRSTRSPQEAKSFIDKVASLLAFVVLLVSILGVLAAPVLVWVIASGLTEEPTTFDTAVQLTRYMFPYIFFMSMVALSSSILNTWKHFAIPAAVPILLNLSLITATLFIAPHLERPIFALAIGVMSGGFLQLFVQIPQLVEARPFSKIHQSDNRSKRSIRSPRAQINGAVAFWCGRRSDFHPDQHKYRVFSSGGIGDLACVRRSSHGISDCAFRSRLGYSSSPESFSSLFQRTEGALQRAIGLGA